MNSILDLLQPYPFERLRALTGAVKPADGLAPIDLTIGEPKHPTPAVLTDALSAALAGLSTYPATAGTMALRETIARWAMRRHGLEQLDPASQVLPINGSREALFAIAQVVVDRSRSGYVLMPNPFYQIYEGAALLAGARPYYVAQQAERGFDCDWQAVPQAVWRETQLLYVCSPGNPTGRVIDLAQWRQLFELSDRYGFVIASDECYSEIWLDQPPLGALSAARQSNRADYRRLLVFSSLSKRSNAPGLRSGFVAGDATLIKRFLLYRTYHGGAMSPVVQAASIAAWNDESHVSENRQLYRDKFDAVLPIVAERLQVARPQAGFYLWARVPVDDTEFTVRLLAEQNVRVLPGSFLGREVDGVNPAERFVRIALVDSLDQCVNAARRIATFNSSQ